MLNEEHPAEEKNGERWRRGDKCSITQWGLTLIIDDDGTTVSLKKEKRHERKHQ